MSQQTRRKLAGAILVTGVVAGFCMSSPSAWADPEVAPDPGVVDAPPAPAPPDPFAFPANPVPPAPVDPAAPPPVDPLAPPPADPLAAPVDPMAPPGVIPAGTPAGQNPTPYTGQPVFAPPTFNPTNGAIAGAAKPI